MRGRIVRSVDFERVLKCPPCAKSTHFALHHLRASPARSVRRPPPTVDHGTEAASPGPLDMRLSTGLADVLSPPVDDSPAARWLGTVVPKRHARRSVTRSLMKRQMHAAFERAAEVPCGLWVLRLRSPFDVKQFPSAASDVLRRAVREELDAMLLALMLRLQRKEQRA